MTTIDMQTMRYINLLDKVSRVKTTKCYNYNNAIIFAVPRGFISQAIGVGSQNLRYISEQIGKKIRIIEQSDGDANNIDKIKKFIQDLVSPLQFNDAEYKDNVLVVNAGSQSKAALIGRNRRREQELARIIKDTYGVEIKIA
ncbi:MAG: hypothetical protein AABX11_05070 [Nanoarchaeota archaeon]